MTTPPSLQSAPLAAALAFVLSGERDLDRLGTIEALAVLATSVRRAISVIFSDGATALVVADEEVLETFTERCTAAIAELAAAAQARLPGEALSAGPISAEHVSRVLYRVAASEQEAAGEAGHPYPPVMSMSALRTLAADSWACAEIAAQANDPAKHARALATEPREVEAVEAAGAELLALFPQSVNDAMREPAFVQRFIERAEALALEMVGNAPAAPVEAPREAA